MVTIYLAPSCTSCRKARRWLEKNNIPYKERNIFKDPLTMTEYKEILQLTENGTEEIVSARSRILHELNVNVDTLSLGELFKVLEAHPEVIRRPILMDEKQIQIGYNEDEIRRFLPRSVRAFELNQLLEVANR